MSLRIYNLTLKIYKTTLKFYKITLKIYKNVSYLQFPIASMDIFSYICTTTQ